MHTHAKGQSQVIDTFLGCRTTPDSVIITLLPAVVISLMTAVAITLLTAVVIAVLAAVVLTLLPAVIQHRSLPPILDPGRGSSALQQVAMSRNHCTLNYTGS